MTDRASSGPASFSGHDRRRLAMTLTQTFDARVFPRVQAVRRVAGSLGVSRPGGQRWLEIYRHRRHPEDWLAAAGVGRPRAATDLDEALLAKLLAQDPRALGYRATTGATPLLGTPRKQEC